MAELSVRDQIRLKSQENSKAWAESAAQRKLALAKVKAQLHKAKLREGKREAKRLLKLNAEQLAVEMLGRVEMARTVSLDAPIPDVKAALAAVHAEAELIERVGKQDRKLWLTESTESPKLPAKVNGRGSIDTSGSDTTDIGEIKAELEEQERVLEQDDQDAGNAIGAGCLPLPVGGLPAEAGPGQASIPPSRQDAQSQAEVCERGGPLGSAEGLACAQAGLGTLSPSLVKPPCPACGADDALVPGRPYQGRPMLDCAKCGRVRVKWG